MKIIRKNLITSPFLIMMAIGVLIAGAPVLGGYLLSINVSSLYVYVVGLPMVIFLSILFIRVGKYLPTGHAKV